MPSPAPPSLSSRGPTMKLRFRMIQSRQYERLRRDDRCRRRSYPLRRPVSLFLIVSVGCLLGLYCRLWISLYRSFDGAHDADDVGGIGLGHFVVSEGRRDPLTVGLQRYLNGTKTDDGATADGKSDVRASPESSHHRTNGNSSSLERQLGNPSIAEQVRAILISRTGSPNLLLGAYLEPPLPLLVGTSNDGESLMKMRVHAPQNLTYVSYPPRRKNIVYGDAIMNNQPGACSNGAQWIFPTSHPKSLDHHFEGNVFKRLPNFDRRWELATGIIGNIDDADGGGGHCPVDADPYLPWIHDAFPSGDGGHVEFVISNKRRCNTDPGRFIPDLKNLEPQVALMQPVPVRRIREGQSEFDHALSSLWSAAPYGRGDATTGHEAFVRDDGGYTPPRYALATSLDDADKDARHTRFICRFHTLGVDDEVATGGSHEARLKKIVLGETLSTYTYNPEQANYRKRGSKPMLLDGHDEQIWNSVYNVRCPVPRDIDGGSLHGIIASGKSVVDGVPSLYLDLIPIRTPVRKSREGFGLPGVANVSFDPERAWGGARVLPRIEASGRWANIPICRPPKVDEGSSAIDPSELATAASRPNDDAVVAAAAREKTHFLVACVWASHSFSTRGQADDADSSTAGRLREFLSYHLRIAGFDHVYVYDNSDATSSSNNDTLDVTDMFSPRLVTRIPWPHRVCNNNPPAAANPGERSSQYAAESSCRARYGPDTTWMATLDVDEYLLPTGERWKTLRQWLEHVTSDEGDTKILNFYQTRALPNVDLMVPYEGGLMKV